jgi:hypothetical protein
MDEKDRRDLVKRLDRALDDVAELVREAKEAIAAGQRRRGKPILRVVKGGKKDKPQRGA